MEKMLEVCKPPEKPWKLTSEDKKRLKRQDIIVVKYKIEQTINEDGSVTTKRVPQMTNITKKVNEQKKAIKTFTAEEKLVELEKIFTK